MFRRAVFLDVCFVLFKSLFYLTTCVCVCLKYKVHCGSALGPGASVLPYYCTTLVCVPALLGALAVWRHKNHKKTVRGSLKVKVQSVGFKKKLRKKERKQNNGLP